MSFIVVPRVVGPDGEEEWLPGIGTAGLTLAAGVSFGRGGMPDPNPALRRIPVDPRWLDRRAADHDQVPRQLLVVVPDGPDGIRWWIRTGQPQAFRIHAGPHLGDGAPPMMDSGTVALSPGASQDLEVWIASQRAWRAALRVRIEQQAGRRSPLPGLDEPTARPRQSQSESALRIWVAEELGAAQRQVLWATVQLRGSDDLRQAVHRASGVPDVPAKWVTIARNLARFVAAQPDPATGEPWLHNVIEYPGLADHMLHGTRLKAGEEQIRQFAAFLARFPEISRWGW